MYANGGYMNDFENELDKIRIELYETTIEMDEENAIFYVNSHARKIAQEFGINIKTTIDEECTQTV